MKVPCTIEYGDVENDEGRTVEGVTAVCSRCGHRTESYGSSERSVRRCLLLLREECPNGENNFYHSEDS